MPIPTPVEVTFIAEVVKIVFAEFALFNPRLRILVSYLIKAELYAPLSSYKHTVVP